MTGTAFALWGAASALAGGALAAGSALERRAVSSRHKALKRSWQGGGAVAKGNGLADALLLRLERFALACGQDCAPAWVQPAASLSKHRIATSLRLAGMPHLGVETAVLWQVQVSLVAAAVGALVGSLLTPMAAVAGALAGAGAGWASLGWALGQRVARRADALERHVSEAVEVLCLGLRAGLSFERSLSLYCRYFPTQLSAELESAQQMWGTGLVTREEALRNLAASYDSAILERIVDAIVRSLRFGSPLAECLEELAQEARRSHRARVEEKVMKAPVKMMLPIGLLILPSMMLLVMGPIMLDLLEGF